MLYKFKSSVTGDLIMLEPHGRQVLEIIGKAPGPQGIVLPEQMPAALAALERAVAADEAQRQAVDTTEDDDRAPPPTPVSLKQRTVPFVDMLKRCAQADVPIVWGV